MPLCGTGRMQAKDSSGEIIQLEKIRYLSGAERDPLLRRYLFVDLHTPRPSCFILISLLNTTILLPVFGLFDYYAVSYVLDLDA
jgi:hypothetical protein